MREVSELPYDKHIFESYMKILKVYNEWDYAKHEKYCSYICMKTNLAYKTSLLTVNKKKGMLLGLST